MKTKEVREFLKDTAESFKEKRFLRLSDKCLKILEQYEVANQILINIRSMSEDKIPESIKDQLDQYFDLTRSKI